MYFYFETWVDILTLLIISHYNISILLANFYYFVKNIDNRYFKWIFDFLNSNKDI